jgi:hypothetical protein
MVRHKIRNFRPGNARHLSPANSRQIQVFDFSREQVNFMFLRQTLGDLIDGSSTPIPPITINHREGDPQAFHFSVISNQNQ